MASSCILQDRNNINCKYLYLDVHGLQQTGTWQPNLRFTSCTGPRAAYGLLIPHPARRCCDDLPASACRMLSPLLPAAAEQVNQRSDGHHRQSPSLAVGIPFHAVCCSYASEVRLRVRGTKEGREDGSG
jgi:hypothetical protein